MAALLVQVPAFCSFFVRLSHLLVPLELVAAIAFAAGQVISICISGPCTLSKKIPAVHLLIPLSGFFLLDVAALLVQVPAFVSFFVRLSHLLVPLELVAAIAFAAGQVI